MADHLPALAALTLLTVICLALVAAEVVVFGEARRALRGLVFQERTTYEAHEAAYRSRWHEPESGEPST